MNIPVETILGAVAGLVELGGPVVAILLVISVVAVTVILAKLAQLASVIGRPTRRIDQALDQWRRGDREGALGRLMRLSGPTARVAAQTARLIGDHGTGGAVRERIEMEAVAEVASLRSQLRILDIIAQVAPLLGLLGTILGMIDAFKVLESAGGEVDPAALAGGIWVALLTTAVGLSVAVPAAIAGNLFEGIIERERMAIEAAATALLTSRLPAEQPHPAAVPAGQVAPGGELANAR